MCLSPVDLSGSGEPCDEDVEEREYNLAANAVPYLKLPKERPLPEELEQIQPLLEHIKHLLPAVVRR